MPHSGRRPVKAIELFGVSNNHICWRRFCDAGLLFVSLTCGGMQLPDRVANLTPATCSHCADGQPPGLASLFVCARGAVMVL